MQCRNRARTNLVNKYVFPLGTYFLLVGNDGQSKKKRIKDVIFGLLISVVEKSRAEGKVMEYRVEGLWVRESFNWKCQLRGDLK